MGRSADLLNAGARRLARAGRILADRLDPPGGVLWLSSLSFTFERGAGVVIRDDGRGCRLAYLAGDYDKSCDDAGPPEGEGRVWVPQPWRPGGAWPPSRAGPPVSTTAILGYLVAMEACLSAATAGVLAITFGAVRELRARVAALEEPPPGDGPTLAADLLGHGPDG